MPHPNPNPANPPLVSYAYHSCAEDHDVVDVKAQDAFCSGITFSEPDSGVG